MGSLFIARFPEEFAEAWKGDVVPPEIGAHGEVDMARVQLLLDLIVEEFLAFVGVILSDPA